MGIFRVTCWWDPRGGIFLQHPPPRPVPLLGSAPAVLPGLGVWWPQLWGCGDTYWAPLALHAQQASPQAVNCSKFSPSRQMIHLDA